MKFCTVTLGVSGFSGITGVSGSDGTSGVSELLPSPGVTTTESPPIETISDL
ncbi:hypothetical protein ACQKM9_20710 [Viridibacillus sp. NPDC093762]|uniref:hypothetical protein n=1 Tax=Viridibacillus sp. NPDC093762 TaxID=3390720 RepID=UPI003D004E63